MDEKTRILESGSNEPLPEIIKQEEKPNEPVAVQDEIVEEKKVEIKSKAKIIAAAAGGFIGGAGAAFAAMELLKPQVSYSQPASPTIPATGPAPVTVINAEAPIATLVNDNMAFDEAFAAARNEAGQGGVFMWKGELYNTYYTEEWDAMTPEQKTEFAHSLDYPDVHLNQSGLAQEINPTPPVVVITPDPVTTVSSSEPGPPNPLPEPEQPVPSPEPKPPVPSPEPDPPLTSPGVQVLPDPLPEPEPPEPQPLEPEIIAVSFDEKGNALFSIDLDNDAQEDAYVVHYQQDEVYDVIVVDLDHDGVPDQAPEIFPSDYLIADPAAPHQDGLSSQGPYVGLVSGDNDVSNFISKEEPSHQPPDYDNHADTADFQHNI